MDAFLLGHGVWTDLNGTAKQRNVSMNGPFVFICPRKITEIERASHRYLRRKQQQSIQGNNHICF